MTTQTEAADMQCALASLRLMALFAERALRTGRTAIALAHIQDIARALDELARMTKQPDERVTA